MNKHKAILKLQTLINEFSSYYSKLFEFNRQFTDVIFSIYNSDIDQYKSLLANTDDLITNNFQDYFTKITSQYADMHLNVINIFNSYIPKIYELGKSVERLDNYYEEMDILKKEKDESFKTYAYYYSKLNKLKLQSKQDKQRIVRNEEKFLNANAIYIQKSCKAYNHLKKLDNKLYPIVNNCLNSVFSIEKDIFQNLSQNYLNFEGIDKSLLIAEEKFLDQVSKAGCSYQPVIFEANLNKDEFS